MKTKLLGLFLLAGSTMFGGSRVFFGIGFGGGPAYYPPPPVAYYPAPVAPGPNYAWVNGYYYPQGPNWGWRTGYWAPRPFLGAYWVGPQYYGYSHRYRAGYWRR